MPNGHGGIPFLGQSVVLALSFSFVTWAPGRLEGGVGWAQVGACLLLAGLFGWSLAYDLHMYNADAYGGAYTPQDKYRSALLRYRILAIIYASISVSVAFGILWWRGLP